MGGASDDGSVIVGSSWTPTSGSHPFRWTRDAGMQDLGVIPGALTSLSAAVSADGAVVCGTGYANPGSIAWRWTARGGLEQIGPGLEAVAISADGSTIVCRDGATGAR